MAKGNEITLNLASVDELFSTEESRTEDKLEHGYEMVSGHRRKRAAKLASITEVPCIIRNLSDDESIIIMVDSNLQREKMLPSEKVFAYKMKLDATQRQKKTRSRRRFFISRQCCMDITPAWKSVFPGVFLF